MFDQRSSPKSPLRVEIIAPWGQALGCACFGSLFRAVFRSVAAAAFSPRLQPRVEGENTIYQP